MLSVADLVAHGDIDELLRRIDGLCAARDWMGLLDLRDRADRAVERGHQLWPVAHHAEYRLALEAPPDLAARMLVEGTGRFALGPMAEVAAQGHTWRELAPHTSAGPVATLAAHERVVRGEDLRETAGTLAPGYELPLVLAPWEPAYAVAHYEAHRADFPAPEWPRSAPIDLPGPEPVIEDRPSTEALRDLVRAWTTASNGRVTATAVDGDAPSAVRALGVTRASLCAVPPDRAIAMMAWAAASGGARAPRPGAAAGRFGAWWAAATITDLVDDWPVEPDELGAAIERLDWFLWDDGDTTSGWQLRVAVADPGEGIAWAVSATDHA